MTPRPGRSPLLFGSPFTNDQLASFATPGKNRGDGSDWVLVLSSDEYRDERAEPGAAAGATLIGEAFNLAELAVRTSLEHLLLLCRD